MPKIPPLFLLHFLHIIFLIIVTFLIIFTVVVLFWFPVKVFLYSQFLHYWKLCSFPLLSSSHWSKGNKKYLTHSIWFLNDSFHFSRKFLSQISTCLSSLMAATELIPLIYLWSIWKMVRWRDHSQHLTHFLLIMLMHMRDSCKSCQVQHLF